MNDLEKARRRMKKRKGNYQPLNDYNFKLFYNGMIKCMVVVLVVMVGVIGTKTNLFTSLQKYIFDQELYKQGVSYVQNTFLSLLPNQEDGIEVNSGVIYQELENHYFYSDSNEVVNLEKGKVIEKGSSEGKEFVTILGYNNVTITYSEIENCDVDLYQEIKKGTVIGSYDEKFKIDFEYLGKEITYETYLGME